ncbi:MAG: hypothetical protein JEZ09_03990 [Salinivirgaceae bacterium]|nr:hypothetical protein [Salinivirgaceae bacterium]
MENKENSYQFNAIGLVVFLWEKRIPIFTLSVIAAILSIIVSFQIDEKYKSEVVVFPTATGSVSQDLLSSSYSNKSLLKLGEDEEIDQLLQVLNSDIIRDLVIEKYNLMEHYEIADNEKYKQTKLYKTFSENITFEPTKFLSVRIRVLDKNPQIAAEIANSISELIDTVMIGMQKEKAFEALSLVETEYFSIKSQIRLYEDSIKIIRNLGITDFYLQTERYSEALGLALVENNQKAINELQNKLNILNKYGGTYNQLKDIISMLRSQERSLIGKYAEAKVDANQSLSKIYVVNKALVAEKKTYPVRSLIVILSTLSTFLLTILSLLIIDIIKKYRTNPSA